MAPLTDFEAVERMALAMVAGAILGFEREAANKAAGLRTYMLVVEGAALFMICAIRLSELMAQSGALSDPGRIASTVVQGIGFIAAGVIITTGREVFGLTTAAGIWVAAAIGLLIGAGFYVVGIVATVLTVTALLVLHAVERKIFPQETRPPQGRRR
jgi:putative Mg2+ transporter-C (MgtC) family protein